MSKIAGRIAGFPPASDDTNVTVEMRRTKNGEKWIRKFGRSTFHSNLGVSSTDQESRLTECFGLLEFDIDLRVVGGRVHYPVTGGRFLGIPLPKFLLPKSETHEFVDEADRACFDVSISLPIAGHIVSYQGWLVPDP